MKPCGTLSIDEHGYCAIEATPDVLLRLKRIFPRVQQSTLRTLQLRLTNEIAFELLWVLDRFPMDIQDSVKRVLRRLAKKHTDTLERLQSIELLPLDCGKFAMALPPRDYQAFAARMYLEKGCLLDGDEIGLGKTPTAICSFTDPRTLPAAVVVQAHLRTQWRDEVTKFIPTARVHVIKCNEIYELPEAEVYIISYSMVASWFEHLARKIKSVVFDEVQELRRQDSAKYKSCLLLSSELGYRLGLSATPIYNWGSEVWSIYNILCPGVLGEESEFITEWCDSYGGKNVVKDPEALGSYLRNNYLFLRRTRKEVGRLLPPETRYVQEVDFNKSLYEAGLSSAENLAQIILSGTFMARGQAAREFDLKLRQATGVAKAAYVAALVRMLVESGEKVLLSGWHRAVYDIWAESLRDLNPLFFTGEESTQEKDRVKQLFIHDKHPLLIMSNRSGSGTDGFQKVCSTVVIGELDWSPQVIDQVIGRILRDGQEVPVNVFIPLAPVGSDPFMSEILGLKRAQSTGIIDLGLNITGTNVEVDPARLRKLAMDFLNRRGKTVAQLPLEISA